MASAVTFDLPEQINKENIAQCVIKATERYQLPSALLYALMAKETRFKTGWRKENDKSISYGIMQVNSYWLPILSKHNIYPKHLVYDVCTNIMVGAYIFRTVFNENNGDTFKALMAYNAGRNLKVGSVRYARAYKYSVDVINYWKWYKKNLHQIVDIQSPAYSILAMR